MPRDKKAPVRRVSALDQSDTVSPLFRPHNELNEHQKMEAYQEEELIKRDLEALAKAERRHEIKLKRLRMEARSAKETEEESDEEDDFSFSSSSSSAVSSSEDEYEPPTNNSMESNQRRNFSRGIFNASQRYNFNIRRIEKKYKQRMRNAELGSRVEIEVNSGAFHFPEEIPETEKKKFIDEFSKFGDQFGFASLSAPCNTVDVLEGNYSLLRKCAEVDFEFKSNSSRSYINEVERSMTEDSDVRVADVSTKRKSLEMPEELPNKRIRTFEPEISPYEKENTEFLPLETKEKPTIRHDPTFEKMNEPMTRKHTSPHKNKKEVRSKEEKPLLDARQEEQTEKAVRVETIVRPINKEIRELEKQADEESCDASCSTSVHTAISNSSESFASLEVQLVSDEEDDLHVEKKTNSAGNSKKETEIAHPQSLKSKCTFWDQRIGSLVDELPIKKLMFFGIPFGSTLQLCEKNCSMLDAWITTPSLIPVDCADTFDSDYRRKLANWRHNDQQYRAGFKTF
ncbi:unnamed protein product [Caenorhabditis auriculariae]|uniref:Uncharacterized protein n=1 Tax=Caenorhabditis auriculariae TaxID=2777116 RepID=A0A8S1GMZ7_9PELO|nr:unnamed protein product [Caenorhabditis auriculariae]